MQHYPLVYNVFELCIEVNNPFNLTSHDFYVCCMSYLDYFKIDICLTAGRCHKRRGDIEMDGRLGKTFVQVQLLPS